METVTAPPLQRPVLPIPTCRGARIHRFPAGRDESGPWARYVPATHRNAETETTMTTLDLARPRDRDTDAPPGHRWLMLAVLLGGQFMALLDAFVVNVAMPSIGADLHASGAALQLVVGGYSAAYAMLLITGARLGDLYGRRRMYMLGVAVFTAASLTCGLAPD